MSAATAPTPRCWIAVACADHAQRGRDHAPVGFMQVCHGKGGPLRRLAPGDLVVYYAPSTTMGGKDRLQSFVSGGLGVHGGGQAGGQHAGDASVLDEGTTIHGFSPG